MKLGPTLDWTCDCKQTQLQPSSSSGSCIIATFNCSGPRKISQGDLDDYCKVRPGCFNLKAVWLRTMIMLVSLCHGACLSVLMNGWELGSEESVMNKPIAWEYLILKSMQAGRARWVCIRNSYSKPALRLGKAVCLVLARTWRLQAPPALQCSRLSSTHVSRWC